MTLEQATAALLGTHPFAGATPADLLALLATCPERTLAAGEVVCKERSYGDEMYVLVAGAVEVTRLDQRGLPRRLAVIHAPDLLGQLTLLDGAVRSATVTATTPVTLRVLTRPVWVRLAHAQTGDGTAARRLLLSALHQQLSKAHAQISNKPAPSRATIVIEDDETDDIEEALGR